MHLSLFLHWLFERSKAQPKLPLVQVLHEEHVESCACFKAMFERRPRGNYKLLIEVLITYLNVLQCS